MARGRTQHEAMRNNARQWEREADGIFTRPLQQWQTWVPDLGLKERLTGRRAAVRVSGPAVGAVRAVELGASSDGQEGQPHRIASYLTGILHSPSSRHVVPAADFAQRLAKEQGRCEHEGSDNTAGQRILAHGVRAMRVRVDVRRARGLRAKAKLRWGSQRGRFVAAEAGRRACLIATRISPFASI
ncbi:hypothetical protein BDZ90DRAFT_91350 [Jaminaea rosea]|uniref:Uncharacterized protein n=1 Tax=Jaminaea rosea TaxID=1569628 RepID=A0A316UJ88_9BASI|nr:hypothetical protein BDZ90DRAFT_91350 [Jaminaea rosea]PWN24994.1 hypothetical protein BDZ90DRAFT_91350 [Jaminaea rosea]